MDVAVVGAGGAIGRQVVSTLVDERVLPAGARLQLVGRAGGPSEAACLGLAVDVADADVEIAPDLEVVCDPDAVDATIVVFAAGATVSTDPHQLGTRQDLAAANVDVFETYAASFERNLRDDAFVLVVSNPVELAVRILARRLGRHRVVGMGAYLDSLRFRRELAHDLGLSRQQVQGLVLGEHGALAVPCWSTVSVWGARPPVGEPTSVWDGAARTLRRPDGPSVAEATVHLRELAGGGRWHDAAAWLASLAPDVRSLVKPFFTHLSGAKTAVGTAQAVTDLVAALLDGNIVIAAGQMEVAGEAYDLHGVTGVPVQLQAGRATIDPVPLADDEMAGLHRAAAALDDLATSVGA